MENANCVGVLRDNATIPDSLSAQLLPSQSWTVIVKLFSCEPNSLERAKVRDDFAYISWWSTRYCCWLTVLQIMLDLRLYTSTEVFFQLLIIITIQWKHPLFCWHVFCTDPASEWWAPRSAHLRSGSDLAKDEGVLWFQCGLCGWKHSRQGVF